MTVNFTHYKLLCQFIADKIKATGMLGGRHGLAPRLHRPTTQQLVYLIEDLL